MARKKNTNTKQKETPVVKEEVVVEEVIDETPTEVEETPVVDDVKVDEETPAANEAIVEEVIVDEIKETPIADEVEEVIVEEVIIDEPKNAPTPTTEDDLLNKAIPTVDVIITENSDDIPTMLKLIVDTKNTPEAAIITRMNDYVKEMSATAITDAKGVANQKKLFSVYKLILDAAEYKAFAQRLTVLNLIILNDESGVLTGAKMSRFDHRWEDRPADRSLWLVLNELITTFASPANRTAAKRKGINVKDGLDIKKHKISETVKTRILNYYGY